MIDEWMIELKPEQCKLYQIMANGWKNKNSQGFSMHLLPKSNDLKRRSSWIKLLEIDLENIKSSVCCLY